MPILIHVSTIIVNSQKKILFVQEAKAIHRGMWNFPGGHVEFGEHPTKAAIREVREETGLDVSLKSIVGIYSGISPNLQSLRFVFEAASYGGTPEAGDEILTLSWMTPGEILGKSDSELVGARFLRQIVQDWESGCSNSIDIITEL